MITAERLRRILHYCPDTGVFTYRHDCKNGSKAGSKAGALTHQGYTRIKIDGKSYRAARLAWLYVHGVWPSKHIDHINRIRLDDSIANLRDVSQSENNRNRCHYTKARGEARLRRPRLLLGVTPHAGKFRAQVCLEHRKKCSVTGFSSADDAAAAYALAMKCLAAAGIQFAKQNIHPFFVANE